MSFLRGGGDGGKRCLTFLPTTNYQTPLVSKHPAAPPPMAVFLLTLVAHRLVILVL